MLLFQTLSYLLLPSFLCMARALSAILPLWNSKKGKMDYFLKQMHHHNGTIAFTTAVPPLTKEPISTRNINKELLRNHRYSGGGRDGRMLLKEGLLSETLDLLNVMDQRGIWADSYTYGCVLQECINVKGLAWGKGVHAHLIKTAFELDRYIRTKLVVFYVECGSVEDGLQVFDKMAERNSVSWNALLAGYSRRGCDEEVLELFVQMGRAGMKPDEFAFASVLKACVGLAALEPCKEVHARIIRSGFEADAILMTAVIGLYAKCGHTNDARQVFDKMSLRDVVSWSALISGYVHQGHCVEALDVFYDMLRAGMVPNEFTFSSIFRACAGEAAPNQGKQIHAQMIRCGLGLHTILKNALVDMYAKCGSIEDARRAYDQISQRDAVSWNAMIAGYSQHGCGEEALALFYQMQKAGAEPDDFTFDSAIRACAGLASLEQGRQVHACIVKSGFESDVVLGSALVDMYAKCGNIAEARQVFNIMSREDVVLWTVMITAYGKHGYGKEVFQLFEQMQQSGMKPDDITFLAVLSACSHAGLVDEGWHYFDSMSLDYCITPRAEHYACMVDLLGRAGCLDEAHEFINKMPFAPNVTVWGAFLGACRIHGNIELGNLAAEHLFELDPQNAGNYVVLSNTYAVAGKWEDIAQVRRKMKDRGLKKEPGCSWIEVKNRVHVFSVGDRSHPQMEEIYGMLEKLAGQMKAAGYVPDTNFVLNDMEDR